jgi:hypothetical protein
LLEALLEVLRITDDTEVGAEPCVKRFEDRPKRVDVRALRAGEEKGDEQVTGRCRDVLAVSVVRTFGADRGVD